MIADFDQFWKQYPRRVGKLAAMKAYKKARTLATAAEILDGVRRYVNGKPQYADFCHPATWLNQGRWMDEYDTPSRQKATQPQNGHVPDAYKPYVPWRLRKLED